MIEMPDKVQSRRLVKTLPGMQVTSDGDPASPLDWDGQAWEEGTVVIDGAQYYVLLQNGYFDLSGYTLQDKTLFIQSVVLQECPNLFGTFGAFVSRIVSTTPLPLDAFEKNSVSRTWALPGHTESTYTMDNIVYGDCSLWTNDTTVSSSVPLTKSVWGTGDATAGDKLYVAVAIAFYKASAQQILYPDTTFVLPSLIGEEPELEYLMRLSRSLEPIY